MKARFSVAVRAFDQAVHEARPADGLAAAAEFHTDALPIAEVLRPDQTLCVDLVLGRRVDSTTAGFDPASAPRRDFSSAAAGGRLVS